jgi:transposase InsO family protein
MQRLSVALPLPSIDIVIPDSQLVMSVLNDALEKHPHPEIFNTDQGSQYTSEIHTKRLKDLGITISMDGTILM